jgi:hypothetical protein
VVVIEAGDALAAEAGRDPGTFILTRSGGDLAASLTVFCSFSGSTAANGIDFTPAGCNATIPANQSSATLTITPNVDNRIEGDETVVATLTGSASNSYAIGSAATATLTLADDPVLITLTASDPDAAEAGPDHGAFLITRSGGDFGQAVTVLLGRGGSASRGTDYAQIPASLTLAANATAATLDIIVIDDAIVENSETVQLSILPSQVYIAVAPGAATVNIADDD